MYNFRARYIAILSLIALKAMVGQAKYRKPLAALFKIDHDDGALINVAEVPDSFSNLTILNITNVPEKMQVPGRQLDFGGDDQSLAQIIGTNIVKIIGSTLTGNLTKLLTSTVNLPIGIFSYEGDSEEVQEVVENLLGEFQNVLPKVTTQPPTTEKAVTPTRRPVPPVIFIQQSLLKANASESNVQEKNSTDSSTKNVGISDVGQVHISGENDDLNKLFNSLEGETASTTISPLLLLLLNQGGVHPEQIGLQTSAVHNNNAPPAAKVTIIHGNDTAQTNLNDILHKVLGRPIPPNLPGNSGQGLQDEESSESSDEDYDDE